MIEEEEIIKSEEGKEDVVEGEEEGRTSFSLDEEELELDKGITERLFQYDDRAVESNSPMYRVRRSYQKEFLKLERLMRDFFHQVQESIGKFNTLYTESPYYENMDIVKVFIEILNRYKNWLTILRQEIFLSQETILELYGLTSRDYVSKEKYDNFVEEMESLKEFIKKQSEEGVIRVDVKNVKDGKVTVHIPLEEFGEDVNLYQTKVIKLKVIGGK